MSKGKVVYREPLTAARERHQRVRAELPLSALKMSKGDPAIPTLLVDEAGRPVESPYLRKTS